MQETEDTIITSLRVVDGRVLGDVRVGSGHVGFGLIEVVIADEVLDRVIGEEGPEF